MEKSICNSVSGINNASSKQILTLPTAHKYKLLTENEGQPTIRIISIHGLQPVYFFISQLGNITIFNRKFKVLRTNLCCIGHKKNRIKVSLGPWINDVILMEDCQKLAMVTTYCNLLIYDISATIFLEEFRIVGLPFLPVCLGYYQQNNEQNSILIIGTDTGEMILFYFSQPCNLLFNKQDQYEVETIHFKNLKDHSGLCNVRIIKRVHHGPINKIQVDSNRKTITSCSFDSTCSLLITDIEKKLLRYQFKVERGVSNFALDHQLEIVVTISPDTLIRVWNTFVTQKPIAILSGHDVKIVDVKLLRQQKIIVSFSRDGVLITWSLDEYVMLQKMNLRFPAFFILGHRPEYSSSPLFVDEEETFILVTCSDWFVQLKFGAIASVNEHESMIETEEQLLTKKGRTKSEEDALRVELKQIINSSQRTQENQQTTSEDNKDIADSNFKLIVEQSHEKLQQKLFQKMNGDPGLVTRDRMRQFVKDGGPHWTLKVHPIEEITFPPLPMTQRMKDLKIVCRTEQDLLNMNLHETKEEIFLPPDINPATISATIKFKKKSKKT